MVVAKRGAETTVHRSDIVCALEPWQMFRGKVVRRPPQYEANVFSVSQLSAPCCADTVGPYLK